MNAVAHLTDASLHCELKRLVGSSNTLTAQLLAHLGEVEARGIHRERACSSLYTYCVYELRMSEDEAQRRCRAARLARQFPMLLEMLAEASLHLTGILLLGPHLTEENCAELLARARFRTKREIERLVAELAPCQDVPSRIVPLHRTGAEDWIVAPLGDLSLHGGSSWPRSTWAAYVRGLAGEVRQLQAGCAAGEAPPRSTEEEVAAVMRGQLSDGGADDGETGVRTPVLDEGRHERQDEGRHEREDERQGLNTLGSTGETRPLASVPRAAASVPAPELRYKVQFTADQAYVELLEEARNLLQHELPSRDLVAVQRRALELLVRKLRQRKYAASERPSPKAPQSVTVTPQTQQETQAKSTLALPPVPHAAAPALNSAPQAKTRVRYSASSKTHLRQSATQLATDPPHAAPPSQTHPRHCAAQSANHSRYIPAEVRRGVWQRDEARCTYLDGHGQRCREQAGLEFHHQHPHARGGPSTLDNIALRCRSHNALAAEQDFGRDLIRKKRARRANLAEQNRAGAAP